MKTLLLTGILRKTDQEAERLFRRIRWALAISLVVLPCLGFAALCVTTYPYPIRGAWVDEAVSHILTQKYGEPVHVKNAVIIRWFWISFDDLAVSSKNKKPLIQAKKGRILLKNMRWDKSFLEVESEITLTDALFFKDYYKDFPDLKWAGVFMRKPVEVKALTFGVKQTRRETHLDITHCQSQDIQIRGSILCDNIKILKQDLLISFSPLLMFRSMF